MNQLQGNTKQNVVVIKSTLAGRTLETRGGRLNAQCQATQNTKAEKNQPLPAIP